MPPEWTTALGLVAATCTTCSFLPQVVKTIRTRRTRDISFLMYFILTCGLLLWLIYGILVQDLPLILANGVSFGLALSVLVLKIRWDGIANMTKGE